MSTLDEHQLMAT